jgi:isopentenyl diphosphate isomerase/L-lactate dehydrogenase-like FMN-dependent dehydrogenase
MMAASPLWAAEEKPIEKAADALNVMDFEAPMRAKVPPAHYGYMATGIDDDKTLRANRSAFDKYYLRPRRFVDVSKTDTALTLFGQKLETPIILAPTGSQKAYHPEGELAVTRAAAARGFQKILSTMTTVPIEEIAAAHKGPLWYQLYPTNRWEYTEKLVKHAEAAGCPVLFLTVDTQGGRNTETETRFARMDARPCPVCHPAGPPRFLSRRKPMWEGFDLNGISTHNAAQTWEVIPKLRKLTKMKLVIKGIEVGEDARRCAEMGVDGIVVSNHGSRALESNRGTLDCLPEVVTAVAGRVPVLIDGGFRRGTDVYKALALGARAVLVGRPYLWGLGAFGQEGVEAVLTILQRELLLTMRQCGTPALGTITKSHIGRNG